MEGNSVWSLDFFLSEFSVHKSSASNYLWTHLLMYINLQCSYSLPIYPVFSCLVFQIIYQITDTVFIVIVLFTNVLLKMNFQFIQLTFYNQYSSGLKLLNARQIFFFTSLLNLRSHIYTAKFCRADLALTQNCKTTCINQSRKITEV